MQFLINVKVVCDHDDGDTFEFIPNANMSHKYFRSCCCCVGRFCFLSGTKNARFGWLYGMFMVRSEICYNNNNNNNSQFVTHFCETIARALRSFGRIVWRGLNLETRTLVRSLALFISSIFCCCFALCSVFFSLVLFLLLDLI